MTQPIDVAYVDIVARDKSLRKFRSTVDDTFKKLDKDIHEHLDGIDKEFDDTLKSIDDHFAKVADSAEESFTKVEKTIKESLNDVDRDVDRHGNRLRRALSAIGAHIGDVFEDVKIKATRGISAAFGVISDGVKNIVGTLGQVGGALGGAVSSSPLLALILVLTPAIIALAAALSQLIGVVGILPTGLAVLVSAIVPVVVAFQNFGDAVSALASGDIEKIDEALKKLAPSARVVAREVAGLLPVLQEFQRGAQDAFFRQLLGVIPRAVNTVLPAIEQNFNRIAIAMGTLTGKFLEFLGSINALNAMNDVFDLTVSIIDKLSGPLIRLFDAISVTASAGVPFVERLVDALGKALDKFSAFITKSIETGDFDKFVEDAIKTVKELVDLLKAAGGLIGTLFEGTEESGHDFIKTLTDLITKMDEFFKSAQGQAVIKDLVRIVEALGVAIGVTLTTLKLLDQQWRVSLAVLELIGRGFFDLLEKIGNFFKSIPEKVDKFVEFLKTIPGKIGDFLQEAFDKVLFAIGFSIGVILLTIQELPGKIVDFLSTLPEKLSTIFTDLGTKSQDKFKELVTNIKQIIVDGFNEVVEFIKSVPDKIINLGPTFLEAGKNLIKSFMNGFRAVGSFIGDIAGDIVSSVKSFLNKAIDKINSGIAAVDAILPGDLGRIPRLARGGVVGRRPGGTLAVVGEGNEDEVVAPLSSLEDILRKFFGDGGTGGMTINFGPNSIGISFNGVTPTEQEAFTVGRAVGDGIANQLAARNIRTQVRAA